MIHCSRLYLILVCCDIFMLLSISFDLLFFLPVWCLLFPAPQAPPVEAVHVDEVGGVVVVLGVVALCFVLLARGLRDYGVAHCECGEEGDEGRVLVFLQLRLEHVVLALFHIVRVIAYGHTQQFHFVAG